MGGRFGKYGDLKRKISLKRSRRAQMKHYLVKEKKQKQPQTK